jgi:hypothetical protein
LALLALALQITLTFGHIHLRDFAHVSGAAFPPRATTVDPTGDHNTGQATDDYCLICASIRLAGTLMLPSQVDPAPLVESIGSSHGHFCSTLCSRIDHALFRARAPPFA